MHEPWNSCKNSVETAQKIDIPDKTKQCVLPFAEFSPFQQRNVYSTINSHSYSFFLWCIPMYECSDLLNFLKAG